MRLQNKVAVITGGGSGMGLAGVQLFAAEGARVVVADLDSVAAKEAAAAVVELGGEAVAVEADVASLEGNQAIVDAALDSFGAIDVFWANAGVAAPMSPVSEQSIDFFDTLMAVNAKGPWLGARVAMPHMKKRPVASFIITSSLSGFRARPNNSAYSASKGAAIQLTRALSIEFAPEVRVNSVAPVSTETPMLRTFMAKQDDIDATIAGQRAGVPLGRLALPADIAKAALFLAGDDSEFITGVTIPVDGGISARS
ncbi:3-ketoacyl-ACP reductase [Mycolicibacterium murale]|uniref:3-ketoacyl-ACP reductase n=1 Tax=Mycolicibacterium murale TaxID=182220 RepID=A0A7I9WXD8_9MYCO|nr:glucose 1-dehydrogenase [Mycolicibacterium murale]ANW62662.1 short-chain dehydrogenase [Mycobacterium sp. djl-10]MCV7181999.1 glucose 1-dehydrogenase [Mycolicibacterium murale]GFG62299.1 3-ketoacyl-ACP reductase [Mycolicibacterium murale]